jgi:urease accessory protein
MKKATLFIIAILLPLSANAHIITENSGFMSGFMHPVLGSDHLLAMLSVGIISAQIGGRAIWTIPATFVCMMVIGGIIGFQEIIIPDTEYILSFSVFALGMSIALGKKVPKTLIMLLVALFGSFHGYAHGIEMPSIVKALPYATGFVISTALIHITGVGIGTTAKIFRKGPMILRYAGAIVAGMGLELLLIMHEL